MALGNSSPGFSPATITSECERTEVVAHKALSLCPSVLLPTTLGSLGSEGVARGSNSTHIPVCPCLLETLLPDHRAFLSPGPLLSRGTPSAC